MKNLLTALALTIAAPVFAQATPAPAPAPAKKACCCEKMGGSMGKMACCDKMTKGKAQGASDPHAGHNMPNGR